MSDSENFIEESDEEIGSNNASRLEVTVEDSDAAYDSDGLIVRRAKPSKRERQILSDSEEDEEKRNEPPAGTLSVGEERERTPIDSEEEEEEFERRALSPRTRMSITGIRPADLDDDSSEIEYSEEEDVEKVEKESYETASGRSEGSSFVDLTALDEDADESSGSDVESSTPTRASLTSSQTKDAKGKKSPRFPTNYGNDSPFTARYSSHFKQAIQDKFSSTIVQQNKNSDESDEVEIISTREETIEISSSSHDSDGENKLDNTNLKTVPLPERYKSKAQQSGATVISTQNLVQPKINAAMAPSQAREIEARPKAGATQPQNIKYVSSEFYKKEQRKLHELKQELLSVENIKERISKNLPDGGRQIRIRIESLHRDIATKSNFIATLRVEDAAPEPNKPLGKIPLIKSPPISQYSKLSAGAGAVPDWDVLTAGVNQIQPKHTGVQGMATFNTQKTLTVDRLKDLHGSLKSCPGEDVLADDPKGLKVKLMKHQKHALAWMAWREQQKPRGGILADDMGLGKTLSMISMVLNSKNRKEEGLDGDKGNDDVDEESGNEGDSKKREWTSKGRRDFYNGNTLVVCPASLVRQWESEVQDKVSRHRLSVCVHHGSNRDTKAKHLRTYDMVVTTYNIVVREFRSQGALFGLKWDRIILDEAHVVRNHKAQSSEAVCSLKGKRRWALTGTPIQNKEMDVYALMKFLRCSPFDDLSHWKRWIDNKSAGGQERLTTVMKTLMLRRTKMQLQERGELGSLPDKSIELIEVNLDKDEMNVYQKIMVYSRTLFAQFLLQRAERDTAFHYQADGNKPTFMQNKNPNDAYFRVHEKFKQLHYGKKEVKSHEILVLLLRLRQICCHPGLIDAMLEDEDNSRALDSDSDTSEPEIDLLKQLERMAITDTSTEDNRSNNLSAEENVPLHPEQEAIAKASAKVLQRNNPVFDLSRPSSKMNKVLETLRHKVLKTQDKAIVVSQWTHVLNILAPHIEALGVATLSLNGSIPVKNRQDIVNDFNDPKSNKKVLLLSLTAGGVGLNLVGANHLFLFDLHWNPQLEAQAQDRIYRVGQNKSVCIYKFMCKDTVEERIKALQDKKLELANGVLTGAKAAASKLTLDDLKGLFGM